MGRMRRRAARETTPRRIVLAVALTLLGTPAGGQESEDEERVERPWDRWFLLDPELDRSLAWSLSDEPPVVLRAGGSIREQFEGYRNFEFGLEPESRGWDRYHLHRLLLHAELTFDERFRIFGQLGNSNIAGNDRPATPVDDDEAYIHQAFAEIGLQGGLESDAGLRLRLGRQELSFGSGRLVSLRDGPNVRRSFDAARLFYRSPAMDWEVFAGAEVRGRPGNFDNGVEDDVLFWGGMRLCARSPSGTSICTTSASTARLRASTPARPARPATRSARACGASTAAGTTTWSP